MQWLIAGLLLFFGTHSISIVAPQWRDRMVQRLGGVAWQGIYGVVALAGLLLIIKGYGLARLSPLVWYVPPAGLRSIARVLLLPVFPLLLAAFLPGKLRDLAKHPMLLAVKLWALAHLLVGGMAHQVLVFGLFLLWAGIDRLSLRRRPPRAPRMAPASAWNDRIAVAGGLLLYLITAVWAHRAIIGVAPYP